MITIKRRTRKGERYEFNCYDKGEAPVEYVYWRDVHKDSKWVLTDDDWVVPVKHLKTYHRKDKTTGELVSRDYLVTFAGPYYTDGTREFILKDRLATRNFSDLNPMSWIEREKKRTRVKMAVKLYVAQLFYKGEKGIDWHAVGRAYRDDQQIPEASAKRLFKHKVIQDMVDKELKEVLTKEGIDKNFVVGLYKRAIAVAESKQDAGNLLKAADMLADYLEMKPTKQTIERTATFDYTRQISAAIEEEEKTLTLTEKKNYIDETEIDNPLLREGDDS